MSDVEVGETPATEARIREALALHQAQPYPLGPALHAARLLARAGHRDHGAHLMHLYSERYAVAERAGEALLAVAERGPMFRVPAGQAIITEGERSDAIMVLLSGIVDVERATAGRLATLNAGQSFGEIAALAGTPRTATVRARVDCELLVLARKTLTQLTQYFPPLKNILVAVYRDRLLSQLVPNGSIFATLDAQKRHTLFARFEPRSAAKGEVILRESQEGIGFCIVVSGRVRVWRFALERRVEELTTFGPGDFFGEISMLYELPATATIEAKDAVVYYLLRREDFHGFMKSWPEEITRLRALAAGRLGYKISERGIDPGEWSFGVQAGEKAWEARGRFSQEAGLTGAMTCPRCGFDQDAGLCCVACGCNVSREAKLMSQPKLRAQMR